MSTLTLQVTLDQSPEIPTRQVRIKHRIDQFGMHYYALNP